MKVRNGFVSNSSSSSFCIIGVSGDKNVNKLISAEGLTFDWEEDNSVYLSYGQYTSNNGIVYAGYDEPYHAGLDAGSLLQDKTIPEAKEYFKNFVKEKFNIDFNLSDIDFEYGECGE